VVLLFWLLLLREKVGMRAYHHETTLTPDLSLRERGEKIKAW
jgi:hypothetical protein